LCFQIFCVETSSLLPKCQRSSCDLACECETSHLRLHSLGQQTGVEVVKRSSTTTGTRGRTFKNLLHLMVVILIETTNLLWLLGMSQLSVHITVLRAVVGLHPQATVGPQLPLAAESVRHFRIFHLWPVHLDNRCLARPVRICKEFATQMAPTLFPTLPT